MNVCGETIMMSTRIILLFRYKFIVISKYLQNITHINSIIICTQFTSFNTSNSVVRFKFCRFFLFILIRNSFSYIHLFYILAKPNKFISFFFFLLPGILQKHSIILICIIIITIKTIYNLRLIIFGCSFILRN